MQLKTIDDTKKFAKDFAEKLDINDIILLSGDLGVGKTFIAGEIIRSLLKSENLNVPSPSFSLLQLYKNSDWNIHHFDLYRLKHKEELNEIGIYEAMTNGLCIIEWPDLLLPIPYNHISIDIKLNKDNTRELLITNYTKE